MRFETKTRLALGAVLLALAPATAAAQARWGGAWGYATSPATKAVKGELPAGTYRFRMRLSQTGDALRLTFTNPQGARPLKIAAAVVAAAAEPRGFALVPGAAKPLRFAGAAGVTITGGQVLDSDPVDFAAASGGDVIVSVTVAEPSTTVAGNAGFPLAFAAAASDPAAAGEADMVAQKLRPFVTLIAVRNPSADCTIVTLGDSITEGARGTRTDWRGWPGTLSQRLIKAGPRHCGVVNMGISGNRVLRDGRGTAAVARFDRDVAAVPGVTHLILLEGINDIWHAANPGEPPLAVPELIAGYRRIIDAAHARGIRVIGGTLTPAFGKIGREMEAQRAEVNHWIRTGGAFDAVIDFEAAIRDTATPPGIRPMFDSGDKIHPGDGGLEAMGRAVPLALFGSGR